VLLAYPIWAAWGCLSELDLEGHFTLQPVLCAAMACVWLWCCCILAGVRGQLPTYAYPDGLCDDDDVGPGYDLWQSSLNAQRRLPTPPLLRSASLVSPFCRDCVMRLRRRSAASMAKA
jgi:hypothetical protein